MSKTLNLIDILLTTGRQLSMAGRSTEALQTLHRLAEFHRLPRSVRAETHMLLADIYFGQQKFKDARRHLTAAVAANFDNAESHYRMALAIEADSDADQDRAEMYYARAVELEPKDATYWVDYGSYLLTMGKDDEAIEALDKAYALGINDAEIVGQVAAELRRADRCDDAARKVRTALFENSGAAAFRRVWQAHQFEMLYIDQDARREVKVRRPRKPTLLPFTPAESSGKYANLGGKTIRIDEAETLTEPQAKTPTPKVAQPYKRPFKG